MHEATDKPMRQGVTVGAPSQDKQDTARLEVCSRHSALYTAGQRRMVRMQCAEAMQLLHTQSLCCLATHLLGLWAGHSRTLG